jgi:cysteine synthase B
VTPRRADTPENIAMGKSVTHAFHDETDPILRRIGRTPLVKLERLGREFKGVTILAKLEGYNPGGSVKDRPAYQMVRAAELSGQLTPGKIILDATSGNTGIAYAMIGARRGYKVRLCLPANASRERKSILKAYGVDLVFTDPGQATDGAMFEAQRLYRENPDLYFYPDQYNNPENPRAHYLTTAPEIIEQTDGKITHFVAGLGTSGTMMGTGRRLREFDPQIKLIAVQPDSPFHGLEGLKHMKTAHQPGIFDPTTLDETVPAPTEEAQRLVRTLAREEGLFVGVSAGAAVWAALHAASKLKEGAVVALLPDGGDRYLSDKFWDGRERTRLACRDGRPRPSFSRCYR